MCLGVLMMPPVVCASAFAKASAGRSQAAESVSVIGEMALPGGLRAALAVLNDPVPPDRSQFLVELIRRTYATPIAVRADPREAALRALLAHLERAALTPGAGPNDTLPLPLTPAIWIGVVFGGRANPANLPGAILESRNASLLYSGLLALDGPTREWIATERNLLSEMATHYAPAFAVAAPGFRVSGGRVRVPGGERADAAWEAVIGRHVNDPAEFLHALLATNDGRLGYFLTAMSELTPGQFAVAVGPDPANYAAALRRIAGVFDRAAPGWKVNERTLWRPRRDPALLLADLATDERGRLMLPGSRAFWTAVFSSDAPGVQHGRTADFTGEAPDFAWLCDQVFSGTPAEQRRRQEAVLFGSRVMKRVTAETAAGALEAVRSASAYPALAAILERARAADVMTYAAAARRAARSSAIGNDERRIRALSQLQGTLGLLARMVSRGSIAPAAFEAAVTSLSQVDWNDKGEYDGALVRWFAGWLQSVKPNTGADDALMQLLAGPATSSRYVDWEGTHYKVDLAAAEGARLSRVFGEHPRPYLFAAQGLAAAADAIATPDLTKEALRDWAQRLETIAASMEWDAQDWQRALSTAVERGDVRGAARLVPRLRLAADDTWTHGAVDIAYAIALGQPEHAAISVADVARRHDFGIHADAPHNTGPWMLPVADVSARGYRISGAVLGLEMALAEFALTRVSTKTPPRKPTISSEERAVFVASVPLVEPALLSDDDRDRIVDAMRTARTRVAAIRTGDDAVALADALPLGSIRRTLFPWILVHDPSRAASFLSPVELLWLGLGDAATRPSLNGWGVSAQARLGCLCLQVIDRRTPDMLAARVNAGILASGFPDLGLRLAELLAELKMPAELLGGVLASAMFDFVNGATSRDEDDRRGLTEFVLALRVDRVEEYLAMLTTGGPLVPPRDDADRLDGVALARRQP